MSAVSLPVWRSFILAPPVSREIVQLARSFQEYQKAGHTVPQFTDEDRKTVQALLASYPQTDRSTRSEEPYRPPYPPQWFHLSESLGNAVNQFRLDTARYRQTEAFRSFSDRPLLSPSPNSNSTTPSPQDQSWATSGRSLQDILAGSSLHPTGGSLHPPGAPSSRRFRSNSVGRGEIRPPPEIRAPSYSPLTDFSALSDTGRRSTSDTARQSGNSNDRPSGDFNSRSTGNSDIEDRPSNTPPSTHTNQTEDIPRNMAGIPPSSGVDQALWNGIMAVATAFAVVPRPGGEQQPSNGNPPPAVKSVEDVGYFDPGYEDPIGTDQSIVSVERYNYYRNVYIFTDHLRDLKKTDFDSKVRKLISTCFKSEALRWYFIELTEIEKDYFRKAFIERWCINLTKRFKKRSSIALKKLQTKSYTYVDARRDRKSRFYMQDILRHARTADYFFVYHQCIIVWNNLELNFRVQISKSLADIILSNFLSQLDAKKSIWMNQAVRHRDDDFNNANSSNTTSKSNRLSKSNRGRQDDFNQQFFVFDFQSSFTYWPSPDYNFYQYKYSAYQNQSNYQYRQLFEDYQSKAFQFASALSVGKQSLLFSTSNVFDSKSKNKSSDKKLSKPDKEKAYNVDDSDNEKHDFQKQDDEIEDYHVSKNIFYYQLFFYNDSKEENDNAIYFITSEIMSPKSIRCRKCNISYAFRNKLHEHIKIECHNKIATAMTAKIFSAEKNSSRSSKFKSSSIIMTTKGFNRKFENFSGSKPLSADIESKKSFKRSSIFFNVSIIVSDVDYSKNVDIDHEFRDWKYVRIQFALFSIDEVKSICLNIEIGIVLSDTKFFKKEALNIFIRIMTFFIFVRDVDSKKHFLNKYAIIFMYFFEVNKNDKSVKIMIIKKIHLINNLKANMLLSIDFIDSEKIDINILNKIVHIDNCEIIVFLKVRIFRVIVQTSIHATKTTYVFFRSEIFLSIHHIVMSTDRDFFFESNELNVFLYVHLVDAKSKYILIRNDSNYIVHIFKNCRMKRLTKLNFFNAF